MMKILLSFFTISFYFIASSQITVTSVDFAVPDDTVIISSSDETNLDLINTGANTYWDFSIINISAQRIDTFLNVADAEMPFKYMFNNPWDFPEHESDFYKSWNDVDFSQASQFGLEVQDPVIFTDVDTNKVENTGIGMYVNGNAVPAQSDTIDNQYILPMAFGDSWSSNSYLNVDLNPAFNGIFRRYQQRTSVVDGWGQIKTPFKTYDVIRVRSELTYQDSIYVDFGFGGDWFELPTPDRVEYDWITNGEKTPVFSVVTQNANGSETITSIEFKDKKRYFASVEDIEDNSAPKVYPNPANDNINILLSQGDDRIVIQDLSGRTIREIQNIQNLTINIDVSDFENGHYLYSIFNDQNTTARGQFVITH